LVAKAKYEVVNRETLQKRDDKDVFGVHAARDTIVIYSSWQS